MQARTQLLRAEGLKKSYGERAAVIDVSLEVAAGEVLGLLGPNGAGKSTTIAMVCGLTPPDAGRVLVGGTAMAQNEAACKRRIGLVPQDIALFEDLPAQANVELFGALYGLPPSQGQAPHHRGADRRRAGRPRTQQTGHLQRRHEAPAEHRVRCSQTTRQSSAN